MAEPTVEEVARGWAGWAAESIVDDLVDNEFIDRSDEEAATLLLTEHLTDIAVSNVVRVKAAEDTKLLAALQAIADEIDDEKHEDEPGEDEMLDSLMKIRDIVRDAQRQCKSHGGT